MALPNETERRISRLKSEAVLIGMRFGEASYDQKDGAWLHVPHFGMPQGWNTDTVGILIDVPWGTPGYPVVAPQWFWTNRDLATNDGTSIDHFFTGDRDPAYQSQGWGHFCVHLNDWKPANGLSLRSGHSLLTYLNLIWTIFHDHGTLSRR
ncbi:hypothetical protein IU429_02895 [Nocardia elegans]|uniref:E2/UBC family protein n=1 Tax=Nocardia elegans TaxID=300029 RepID=A0ABW6TN60_9NOCA|nr:E2/UBC family protein [Nocardia elegans]MBF6446607.1 hypothetical protein [Nocardia elegans]